MKQLLTMALATMGLGFAAWGETDREQWQRDPGGMRARMAQKLRRSGGTSQFPVPKSCDVRFVASEGGDLGDEVWSCGTIDFSLYIDRYYGDKDAIQRQIKSGALPKTATLTMIVYDVDDHSTHNPPEHDQVSINGYRLQDLTGANDEWTKQTFDIPMEALNLPKYSGDVAENKIHIDVGVGSDPHTWVTAIHWASLDIPAAPPVVFAHGINSGSYAFDKLDKKIKDELGLYTAKTNFSNNGNDYIGNYEALEKVIRKVKQDCRVEKVNIVAHSMGGLRSRAYTGSHRDVMKVLQVATPNGGSPIADFMIKWKTDALTDVAKRVTAGKMTVLEASDRLNKIRSAVSKMSTETFNMKLDPWNDEAVVCLQTKFMRDYNVDHPLNPEVDYGIVAGCIPDVPFALKALANSWLASVAAWYYDDRINEFVDGFLKIEDQATAEYVREYLKANVADLVKELWEDSDAIVKVKSAHTMVSKLPGSALHGSYAEVWHSGLLEGGVDMTFGSIRSKLVEKKKPDALVRRPFARTNLQSRRMERNEIGASEDGDGLGSIGLKTGLLVGGDVETYVFDVVKGGKTVVNVAVNGIGEASVTYVLKDPSGNVCTDGMTGVVCNEENGGFSCLLSAPAVGRWTVEFSTPQTAEAGLWLAFAAEAGSDVTVVPKLSSRFARVGSQFLLTVEPKVDTRHVQGTVVISAVDSKNDVVFFQAKDDGAYPDAVANDGVYSAAVSAETAGDYRFVVDVDASSPVVFSRSAELTGVAYESGSAFNKTVNYNLQDEDGNGLCDRLNVSFGVTVDKAASYRVLATLSDTAGNEVCKAWSDTVSCTAGETTFSVAFDGWEINGHGACGGYKVSSAELIEMGDAYEATIDTMTDCLTISGYGYKEFEHELIELVGTWTESTTDDNGDGVLDQLKIVAPIRVDDLMAGTYDWSASIRDGNGETVAYATGRVTFRAGENTTSITMAFPAKEIAEKNVDGPYTAGNLILWGNGKNLTLGGEYLTKAYDVASFGGAGHVDLAFVQPQDGSAAFGLCDKDGKPVDGFSQGEDVYVFANYANKIAGQAVPSPFKAGIVCPNGESNLVDCAALAKDEAGAFNFAMPEGVLRLAPGNYEMTFVLDADGVYHEADRDNNVGKLSFTVRHRQLVPDSKVKPFSLDPKNDYAIVAATKYGGYLLDGAGRMSGVIDIKVGKPSKVGACSVSGSLTMLGAKKKSLKLPKGTKGVSSGKKVRLEAGAETVTLDISGNALSGSYGKYTISGVRIDSKETFGGLSQETYALALFTGKASGEAADLAKGSSALTVAFKNKGKAKVSGVMGDGTKVSTTAQMLAGESDYCLPVLSQLYGKKTGGFGLLIWIDQKGRVQVDGLSDWDASSSSSPFKAAFSNEVPVASIADAKSPKAFELPGKPLSKVAGQKVYTALLPSSVKLTVAGNKWDAGKSEKVTVDGGKVQGGTNPSALKLTYAPKTGLFKGGFTVYSDSNGKLKKTKATVTGVMVEDSGYGSAVIKKTGSMPVTVGK